MNPVDKIIYILVILGNRNSKDIKQRKIIFLKHHLGAFLAVVISLRWSGGKALGDFSQFESFYKLNFVQVILRMVLTPRRRCTDIFYQLEQFVFL